MHAQETELVQRVRALSLDMDGADPLDEAAELALEHGRFEHAAFLAADDGFALVDGGDLTLAVAPDARGAGVGGGLAARALAVQEPPVRAWSHSDHPAADALAARHGWVRARELWVMRRATSRPLPALDVPAGLQLRGYTEADADAVLALNAAAFAHHPEQGSLDVDGLAERTSEPWFDPAGLLLLLDGDDLVAFHWTKQHDDATGEVYVVGVAPSAQGRGLGRVVTLAGLAHLAQRGVDEVLLYVESDNGPAVHVYERLGFEHADADTHVQYRAPHPA